MAIAYLSLGSNLGDRVGYVQQATCLLKSCAEINIVTTSSLYETEPWQMVSEKWFVNAVVQISTTLSPEKLLQECQKIENMLGRKRVEGEKNYVARTLDIDIIFYDNLVLNTPELTIPHKLFHKRAFMIIPMLEIADDFVHPIFNKTVEELYEEIENPEIVYLYGTRREDDDWDK